MLKHVKTRLYNLLDTSGFEPSLFGSDGKQVTLPEEADNFQFKFKIDGESYGTVTISLPESVDMLIYYNQSVASSPKGASMDWYSFLRKLKVFAHRNQLGFKLKNQDKLSFDLKKRNTSFELTEGFTPVNRRHSINDSIPEAKIIIQHSRPMGESDQRFRHVEKIFVETQTGERLLLPTTRPGLSKLYARHIAEGGHPYDDNGRRLSRLVEKFTQTHNFIRACSRNRLDEAANEVVNSLVEANKKLKRKLEKMTTKRGYHVFFDFSQPAEILEDCAINETACEKFSHMEECTTLVKEMISSVSEENLITKAVMDVDAWSNGLVETESETLVSRLTELIGPKSKFFPAGPDGVNANQILGEFISDQDLFDEIAYLGSKNPEFDVRPVIQQWLASQEDSKMKMVYSRVYGDSVPK